MCQALQSLLEKSPSLGSGGLRTGNSIVESLLGQVASLVGGIEDLVVEDGEVKGKTQADGVRGRQLGLGNFGGSLVGLERLVGGVLALVANGKLGEITVVVTLPRLGLGPAETAYQSGNYSHLVVEHLRLARLGRRDQVLVKDAEDVLANLGELSLDLLAVLLDEVDLGGVALGLFLLLDRGDDSPRRTASANNVLVGNR